MAKKGQAPKPSAPLDLTEEEVRAARDGRGTHKLPEAGPRSCPAAIIEISQESDRFVTGAGFVR